MAYDNDTYDAYDTPMLRSTVTNVSTVANVATNGGYAELESADHRDHRNYKNARRVGRTTSAVQILTLVLVTMLFLFEAGKIGVAGYYYVQNKPEILNIISDIKGWYNQTSTFLKEVLLDEPIVMSSLGQLPGFINESDTFMNTVLGYLSALDAGVRCPNGLVGVQRNVTWCAS
jgi:hypothetical protein